jgi:hypothetical protein
MSWSLHNLFPVCIKPTCPLFHTRHMLPHQEEIATQILTGEENYIYWQGGVGSAKTMLYAALACALALLIPESEGILFRKDLSDNNKTLWKYFKNSVKAACESGLITTPYEKLWKFKNQGDYNECHFPNGSIVYRGQTKSWSAYMGPTYDFIVVSDAMENNNFGEIFRGEGVVGGLQSRLRGQRSGFFKLPTGQYKDMRRFLIETNPPPNISELHSLFGREPGVRELTKTPDPITGHYITYRHIQTTSTQNDHNPPSYVLEIQATHSNIDDIRRILEGKTVPYYGGIRVVETFHPELHVANFNVDPTLPLFIGIDPGGQHPGVTFNQIKKCAYDKDHYITLSEISNLYHKTTYELADYRNADQLGILQHLADFYPEHFDLEAYTQVRNRLLASVEDPARINSTILENHFHNIFFCIDKSGDSKSRTNRDAKSDRTILLTEYGIRCRYRTNIGLDKSLDRVRRLHKDICTCGLPARMIDRNCELLIDAYSGGYRYPKKRDGTYGEKPVEDHKYEDICDADRYALENFLWSSVEVEEQRHVHSIERQLPWTWMGDLTRG